MTNADADDGWRAEATAAIEGNFMAWIALATVLPGGQLIEEADCTWYQTPLRDAHFNGVLRARFGSESVEGRLRQLVDAFDECRAPMDWWLMPSSTPVDLARRLVGVGFHRGGDWPGMAVELDRLRDDGPALSGLQCTEIVSSTELTTWMGVHARSFGTAEPERDAVHEIYRRLMQDPQPRLRHFLGWYHGEPVAVASLFLAGGAAGVYNIGTLPDARGRGIGRDMTLVGLRHARAAGYRIGVLGASRMGLPMYRRLGFQEYCRLRWMERPVAHRPHGRAHRPGRARPPGPLRGDGG